MDKGRVFVAVIPPCEIITYIDEIETELKNFHWNRHVKWVKKSNIHMTFKFIGEIDRLKFPEIEKRLSESLNHLKGFEVSCGDFVLFPNRFRPRVLGLEVKSDILTDVSQRIENNLKKAGIKKEKREFRGHITLGRFKKSLKNSINIKYKPQKRSFYINEILLVESFLNPEGARYVIKKRFGLK